MGFLGMLIWLVAMIVGGYLVIVKKMVNLGRILIMICALIPGVILFFFAVLLMLFSAALHKEAYFIIFVILEILFLMLIAFALWGGLKKKITRYLFCMGFVFCLLMGTGFYIHQYYVERIPTIGENDHLLMQYAPYALNSKVSNLPGEASLALTEEYPIIDGATALYPMYSAFAKAVYPKELIDDIVVENGNKSVFHENKYLKCSTTSKAYEKIVTGEADIIFAAAPSEEQRQFAQDNDVELIYTPIGREAFVFFVNRKNPIITLSVEQIQNIYSGEITSWQELEVRGIGEIRAFQRNNGSGSQSALIRMMDGKELMTPPEENVLADMGGIIRRTADYKNYKNAIGYSFRFYSTEMVKNNQIKLLCINGVEPNIDNIKNGTYPITFEFYAVTRSNMTNNTKRLLDWILGEQGQRLIKMTGYTPIN